MSIPTPWIRLSHTVCVGVPALVRPELHYLGDEPGSEQFWANVADQRIQYIRALTYRKMNGAS